MQKLFVSLSMLVIGVASAYALPSAATGYSLFWSDEFNGTSLDTVNNWSYDTSQISETMPLHYTRGCVTVENGNLVILSKYSGNSDSYTNGEGDAYTSGWIDGHDMKTFTYGYFEVRMITPVGQVPGPGLWSSVWLLGNSMWHGIGWPACGEMELYDQRPSDAVVQPPSPQPIPATIGDNEFIASCHYAGVNGSPSYHQMQHNYSNCLYDGYHTYGLLWDSTHVEYYFDDTLYWGRDFPIMNATNFGTPSINLPENTVAFHSPFYWTINVQIGGAYQGYDIHNNIFPTKMLVDYVRVYQKGIVKTVNEDVKQQTSRLFTLINPSTARLTVYDLSGKLVADYSSNVRRMKPGDNAMNMTPSPLSNGVYVVKLIDNRVSASRILVTAR